MCCLTVHVDLQDWPTPPEPFLSPEIDDNNHTANRTGQQIYFTRKIKDEVKKNNLTLIPSAQIDFGHTILNKYSETGNLGMTFEDQHVRTRNLRGAIAFYEDLSNEEIKFKRHGKLEYLADLYPKKPTFLYNFNTLNLFHNGYGFRQL